MSYLFAALRYANVPNKTRSRKSEAALPGLEFRQEVGSGDLPAVARNRAKRCCMTRLGERGADIRHLRHKIAEITGIAYRTFDTLIGQNSRYDQLLHT